jgi:AraC-like DNA-binding protein
MAEVLRTDDVTQADRFAQWRHWISATFVPLECAPVTREPFHGEVAHWELGELLVSRVAAHPHLASRTRRMIALRDAGYYKVGLLTRGSCRLSQEGREALLRPGDLAIYDCRRPYTMVFDEPHEMSFLMFPCDRLRLPPAAVEQVLVTPVSSSDRTGSLVAPFLQRLVAHLADPGLDPVAIARANHISVRYLHKLFHDQGTSVARWVRERRLANCRRDLEDPALAQRGGHAIARRWGFEDPAHFSKIFKASFGEPPGAYRQITGGAGRAGGVVPPAR